MDKKRIQRQHSPRKILGKTIYNHQIDFPPDQFNIAYDHNDEIKSQSIAGLGEYLKKILLNKTQQSCHSTT